MQAAPAISTPQPGMKLANLFEVRDGAPVWEQGLVGLWFFVTVGFLPLPGVSVARYLCILVLFGILIAHHKQILPVLMRSWILFTLPVLGILSYSWSPYPAEALRTGIFLFLTPLIIVIVASRLSVQQIIRCMMFAGAFLTVASLPLMMELASGSRVGKNKFAIEMLFVMLTSLAVLLNSREHLWIRLFALPFVPICFAFQLIADSATSLVLAVLGIASLLGTKYVWAGLRRVQNVPKFLLLTSCVVLLIGAIFIVNIPGNSIAGSFLDLVGKDGTLTGRTELWAGAELQSRAHPWLGVGLEGFWQYDTGLAQTLNENNHKDYGTKLSFHNAYWEVRVHLGFVGLAVFCMIVAWSAWRALALWVADPSLANSALLICVAIILLTSLTESYLWGTFSTSVTLFYTAAIAGFRRPEKLYRGQVRLVNPDEDSDALGV